MSHANAALTPRHRLKVARLVVDDGYPISEVAARFQVSWPTVKRWVDRYLSGDPMHDRSLRAKSSPNKTGSSQIAVDCWAAFDRRLTRAGISVKAGVEEGALGLAG